MSPEMENGGRSAAEGDILPSGGHSTCLPTIIEGDIFYLLPKVPCTKVGHFAICPVAEMFYGENVTFLPCNILAMVNISKCPILFLAG